MSEFSDSESAHDRDGRADPDMIVKPQQGQTWYRTGRRESYPYLALSVHHTATGDFHEQTNSAANTSPILISDVHPRGNTQELWPLTTPPMKLPSVLFNSSGSSSTPIVDLSKPAERLHRDGPSRQNPTGPPRTFRTVPNPLVSFQAHTKLSYFVNEDGSNNGKISSSEDSQRTDHDEDSHVPRERFTDVPHRDLYLSNVSAQARYRQSRRISSPLKERQVLNHGSRDFELRALTSSDAALSNRDECREDPECKGARSRREFTDVPFPSFALSNRVRRPYRQYSRSLSRSRSRDRSRPRCDSSSSEENQVRRKRMKACIQETLGPTCDRLEAQNATAGTSLPLRRIKLIKLVLYNEREDSLDAVLHEFSIESVPAYIALSYVWGHDIPRSKIVVNEMDGSIRDNLFMALRGLQLLCPGEYIWTDALCIEQSNEEEKSHVVQHMGEIFHAAERVYAWLGPSDPGDGGVGNSSDVLWHQLRDIGNLFWEQAGHNRRLDQTPFNMEPIVEKLLPDLDARFAKPPEEGGFSSRAYTDFSNRVYWRRVWVLQEVYLAKELIFCCGEQTMDSTTLAGALILLESYQKHVAVDEKRLADNPRLNQFAFTAPCFPEMHRLLIYTSIYPQEVHSLRIAMTNFCVKELPRGSQSTDPRDMIFGLLGFANKEEREYIKADYSKPVQEVYRDTTQMLMQRGWTDVLAWSQPQEKGILNLPSWVPDFSSTIYETMCSQWQAKHWLCRFQASTNLTPRTYSGDVKGDSTLRWAGVILDTIDQVGSLWYPRVSERADGLTQQNSTMDSRSAEYDSILTYFTEIRDFTEKSIQRAIERSPSYIIDQSADYSLEGSMHVDQQHEQSPRPVQIDNMTRREAMWRVPCADQLLVNSQLVRNHASMESAYNAVLLDMTKSMSEPKNSSDTSISEEGRAYVETILRWVRKRPTLSAGGFVGLAPGDTRNGDIVVLLQSCSAPYILRRQDESAGRMTYKLVGEAFVWGIMDGEYQGDCDEVFDIL